MADSRSLKSHTVKSLIISPSLYSHSFEIEKIKIAVAIWQVTGQGVENTKWPTVLHSQ